VTDDDLAFADLATLGKLLRARHVSSMELTELALARLGRYGPSYNAVVTLVPDRAHDEARRADRELAAGHDRGPLHGIPYGAKDLLAARGAPTTWGAEPYRHQVFEYDATVVRKLAAAGAVLVAKLAMVELAGGFGYDTADASFTGPGRTPWNRAYWSGGSSSGSAAAVSAGLVPYAIGTETAGSIVFPSTSCGVTGLRPTFGRVSRHGAMALCWSLDKIGPIARNASDAEIVLRAIAGSDPDDSHAVDRPFPGLRGRPRIGVVAHATEKTMPAVRENFHRSLAILAEYCDLERDVAVPDLPYGPAVGTIVNAEGAAAFRTLIESGKSRELRAPADRTGGYVAYATPAVDYIDAQRQRTRMVAALAHAFGEFDAVVAPSLPTVALPIDLPFSKAYPKYPGVVDLISPGNLAGIPALCVPNGFGEHGLPTGLTFVGSAFEEAKLVAIGTEYQARTTFAIARPKVE